MRLHCKVEDLDLFSVLVLIFHAREFQPQIPVVLRAKTVRFLSATEMGDITYQKL